MFGGLPDWSFLWKRLNFYLSTWTACKDKSCLRAADSLSDTANERGCVQKNSKIITNGWSKKHRYVKISNFQVLDLPLVVELFCCLFVYILFKYKRGSSRPLAPPCASCLNLLSCRILFTWKRRSTTLKWMVILKPLNLVLKHTFKTRLRSKTV